MKLKILGNAIYGHEVIKTLEMLGGRNRNNYTGKMSDLVYFIDNGFICCELEWDSDGRYLIEEFLKKFPYKTGDEVVTIEGEHCKITSMQWDNEREEVMYGLNCYDSLVFSASFLNPCTKQKEETMEERIKIDIPKGYEFAGIDDDGNQVVFEKIKPQYPKTYEECCKVLLLKPERATFSISGLEYQRHLVVNLQRLLICRDAYWKMAGDWKPNWKDCSGRYFAIATTNGDIGFMSSVCIDNAILVFPTEEMRDSFYENFKDLIESCKELL